MFKTIDEVTTYVSKHIPDFGLENELEATEIGDGNLNYIFRVSDKKTGRSVVVKQAVPYARSTKDYALTAKRNRLEAEALKHYSSYVPHLVPDVYFNDDQNNCFIMEDLKSFDNLRAALLQRQEYDFLSDQIASFLAETLIHTSDISLDPLEKKELVKKFINSELCKISEDLVFTDPFKNVGNTNNIFPPNNDYIHDKLYNDSDLHLEAAKLKFLFMNKPEALIHGDLHTGSIFINEKGIKIIDPEFAFFGPIGYDIGNVVGNLIFVYANTLATLDKGSAKDKFLTWLERTISDTIDLFRQKTQVLFFSEVKDAMAATPGFFDWYMDGLISDSAGYAGLEMIRRIVGEAGVEDIESIQKTEARLSAERFVITLAKVFIKERQAIRKGPDFVSRIQECVAGSDGLS